jgi:hypothetical protein
VAVPGAERRKERLPSSPPDMSNVLSDASGELWRTREVRTLEEDWWVRVGFVYARSDDSWGFEIEGRAQKIAWPSVPVVRTVLEDRNVH